MATFDVGALLLRGNWVFRDRLEVLKTENREIIGATSDYGEIYRIFQETPPTAMVPSEYPILIALVNPRATGA